MACPPTREWSAVAAGTSRTTKGNATSEAVSVADRRSAPVWPTSAMRRRPAPYCRRGPWSWPASWPASSWHSSVISLQKDQGPSERSRRSLPLRMASIFHPDLRFGQRNLDVGRLLVSKGIEILPKSRGRDVWDHRLPLWTAWIFHFNRRPSTPSRLVFKNSRSSRRVEEETAWNTATGPDFSFWAEFSSGYSGRWSAIDLKEKIKILPKDRGREVWDHRLQSWIFHSDLRFGQHIHSVRRHSVSKKIKILPSGWKRDVRDWSLPSWMVASSGLFVGFFVDENLDTDLAPSKNNRGRAVFWYHFF